MNIRDIKLAIACGEESEEVKAFNNFFDNLFSGLTIYTKNDNPDLIFMKGGKFIMCQDLKLGILWCRYDDFWKILRTIYHCTYTEIQEIIQYKVEEAFKTGALTPWDGSLANLERVEEAFKTGALTPDRAYAEDLIAVEEAFKTGALTPTSFSWLECLSVEEAFKRGALTPKFCSSTKVLKVEEAFKTVALTPN